MPYPVTNIFWIAGNIIFDLNTGKASSVLMLVNRESDATVFSEQDAHAYFSFIRQRAQSIEWFLERSPQRALGPEGWVIRGVQTVMVG
jgi:hypothetical protein